MSTIELSHPQLVIKLFADKKRFLSVPEVKNEFRHWQNSTLKQTISKPSII